ncbi:MAG TPA: hypothetical protein VFF06_10785 [Polyangia bacterium]|nr:hypothetical protein [Polyangia bacterium]
MRAWMVVVAACGGLLLPLSARAQGEQPPFGGAMTQTPQQRTDEAKKHLGEIDVYLRDAENNARQLYQMSALQSGYMDPLIVREDVANLDRALANADKHLSHVRTLPNARIGDPGRLDSLQRTLSQSRAQLQNLRTLPSDVDRGQLRDAATNLILALRRADRDFAVIATAVGLPRVDQVDVSEKHPVRGHDDDFDLDSPRIHGRGTDSGLGTGSMSPEHGMPPERSVPPPQSPSSPEQGAWPRY